MAFEAELFFFLILFIYLFLAVLGLRFCARARYALIVHFKMTSVANRQLILFDACSVAWEPEVFTGIDFARDILLGCGVDTKKLFLAPRYLPAILF